MTTTVKEVLQFVRENDVKFIRLGFCDPLGFQKNISILPDRLEDAFTNGVSFDASAVKGFGDVTHSDIFLFPDARTLTILPWRTGPGRVIRFYCDIKNPDGSDFYGDVRTLLRKAIERGEKMGYNCKIGTECEFYLFKTDDMAEPTYTTFDNGGYLDISPIDKGENIRREICLCLLEMGINPESSHHEQGPGQNEIDFEFADALSAADNLLTFKSTVKAIAARNGLFASFMPKPLADKSGSGLHINMSLSQNGMNIFKNTADEHSQAAESFIAGILEKVKEMSLFLNPINNSYDRLGKNEAPKFISWSHQNRSQLIRIPAASGEKIRMELRSADPAVNPYIAFALLMNAGFDGIEKGLVLCEPVNSNLFTADKSVTEGLDSLPSNINESIEIASTSEFVKNVVGETFLQQYLKVIKNETCGFSKAEDKERNFKII